MSDLAGAVVWGIVPFAPQAPFRLYAGTGTEPTKVPDAAPIINAAIKGGNQFTYVVEGKARPVLILSDATDASFGEYIALRLSRFSKLTASEQRAVRAQEEPTLFHLKPEKFALPEENAAMIHGAVRLHRSALDAKVCGRLDSAELTTVHERFIRLHGFNVDNLVVERYNKLAAAQRSKKPSQGST